MRIRQHEGRYSMTTDRAGILDARLGTIAALARDVRADLAYELVLRGLDVETADAVVEVLATMGEAMELPALRFADDGEALRAD